MLPQTIKNKNLPRTLKIPKEIYSYLNQKERIGYWFISWLGRSYYKGDKICREFYVTLCSNEYFNFNNEAETFRLEFPEEFSIRYKQGNYYKFNGDFLKSAFDSKEIKSIKNVDFSRNDNTEIINFEELVKDNYPLYQQSENDTSYINPYKDVPCYVIEIDRKKYIIPLNVIQNYFFAISSLTIYNLIHGIIRESLYLPYKVDGEFIVPYRGSFIYENEARFLSKFYFLKDANFNSIYNIHESFQTNLMNARKNNSVLKSYINYGIPFDRKTKLSLDLYFHPIDKLKTINMVYNIGNVKPQNNTLFPTTNFYLDNVDASLKEDNTDYSQNIGNIKVTNVKDDNFDIVNNSVSTNSNMMTEIKVGDNSPKFLETPEIKTVIPTRIREAHGFQQHYINHIIKYDEQIQSQNSTSDTGIVNYNIDSNEDSDYMEIVMMVFESLMQNENFECEYIFLKRQKNSVFSYDPYDFAKKGSIVIFQITNESTTYCIIARRNSLQRIGIIRKFGEGKYDAENDQNLKSGIYHISKVYKYNWSKSKTVKSSYIKNTFGFEVIHALNKNKGKTTKEEKTLNLYDRIIEIISPKET